MRFYQTFRLKTVKLVHFCDSVCPELLIHLAPDRRRLQSFGLKNSGYYHYKLCDFVITLWNWRLWNLGAQRARDNIREDKLIKRTQLKDKTKTLSLVIYLLRISSITCVLLAWIWGCVLQEPRRKHVLCDSVKNRNRINEQRGHNRTSRLLSANVLVPVTVRGEQSRKRKARRPRNRKHPLIWAKEQRN